jgi:SAM-dependent methyltransferase
MYNNIYKNESLFNKYLESIYYTVESKEKILRSILLKVSIHQDKTICLLPSDIGIYYELLIKIAPQNKFILIDKSNIPLHFILNKNNHGNTRAHQLDICEIFAFKNEIDIAINILAINHLDNLNKFFSNVYQSLKQNGFFVIVTLSPADEKKNIMSVFFKESNKNYNSLSQIEESLLKVGFNSIALDNLSFNIDTKKEDIPKVFNKFSNSFLYKKSEEQIQNFQKFLIDKSNNGVLTTLHNYSLIIAQKNIYDKI